MQQAAAECGVHIATGDTKVVPRGSADKVFITTAGVGLILRPGFRGVPRFLATGSSSPARWAITAPR